MPDKSLVDLILQAPEEAELLALLRDVADADDEDREKAEQRLEKYSGSLALRSKVDAYSHLMAFFNAQQATTKAEIDRLKKRFEYWSRASQTLERHAVFALTLTEPDRNGRHRLEGNHSTLTLRANPPAVDFHDEKQPWTCVPDEYVRVTVTMPLAAWRNLRAEHLIDKIEYSVPKDPIKRAIESGKPVPGASLSQSMRVQRT